MLNHLVEAEILEIIFLFVLFLQGIRIRDWMYGKLYPQLLFLLFILILSLSFDTQSVLALNCGSPKYWTDDPPASALQEVSVIHCATTSSVIRFYRVLDGFVSSWHNLQSSEEGPSIEKMSQ